MWSVRKKEVCTCDTAAWVFFLRKKRIFAHYKGLFKEGKETLRKLVYFNDFHDKIKRV